MRFLLRNVEKKIAKVYESYRFCRLDIEFSHYNELLHRFNIFTKIKNEI